DLGTLSNLVKEPNCQECLEIVNRMEQRGFVPVQARIFAARAYANMGNYPQAISILQKVVQENPKNAQAQTVLAHCEAKTGNADDALAIYRKLMNDDSILALENYAELMIRLKRNQELQTTIDQFASGKKLSVKHYPVLGEIYLLLQQPERARVFLQKA